MPVFPAPSGRITVTACAPAYLESTGIRRRLPERGKGERMRREISPRTNWRGWLATVGIFLMLAVFQSLDVFR